MTSAIEGQRRALGIPIPVRVFVVALFAVAGPATGCLSVDVPPGPGDADSGVGSLADTDMDGLCDSFETFYGTNPKSQDTDQDRIVDGLEVLLAFDPNEASSPASFQRVLLEARADSFASVEIESLLTGSGENYTAFTTASLLRFNTESTAADFLVGTRALSATPAGNVGAIEGDAGRFRGVSGQTALLSEVTFAFGENAPSDCILDVPFQFGIKGPGGAALAANNVTGVIVVVPDGDPAAAKHCAPVITCVSP
jgi:hypothetical protein